MRVFSLVLFLILWTSPSIPFAQTHFVDALDRTIEQMGAGGEGAIHVNKPLVAFLRFTASSKGWLMYIEDRDTTTHMSFGDPYAYFRGERKDFYLSRHNQIYDPERITHILHVTDPAGEDLYAVPLADKYGPFSSLTGRFLNNRLILLELTDRLGNTSPAIVVDFIKKKVWAWVWMHDLMITQVEASPDEEHFVVALVNDKAHEKILYYDGSLLLPYFDSEAPLASDAPQKFDEHLASMEDKLKANYPEGFQFTMDREGMWSADGRYLAVVQVPSKSRKSATASADTTATRDSQEAAVLLVDTAKAGPGKDYRQYSTRLPFTVPTEWKSSSDSPDQPPVQSTLIARFDAAQNAIEVSSRRRADIKLNLPLPKGWNAKE